MKAEIYQSALRSLNKTILLNYMVALHIQARGLLKIFQQQRLLIGKK
nr:hypothetical protein EATA8330_29450 [Enterobacter asburiae]